MATSFPHSRKHRPPFPSLAIRLRSLESELAAEQIAALVDTGADITSVPTRMLEQIQAPEADEVRLRSHWGHAISVVTYLVDIVIGDLTLPAIEVAGDTINSEVVLGRDVINQLILLVDGPLNSTSVLDKRLRRAGGRTG